MSAPSVAFDSATHPRHSGARQATAVSNPAEPLPIPDEIWQELLDFLRANKPGQFILHVAKGEAEGHVVGAGVAYEIRMPKGPGRA